MSATSLFIPHVFPNFDKDYVAKAFAHCGEVERVDLVAKQDRDGKMYNATYVHFKKWHNTQVAIDFQNKVNEGNTTFYHDSSTYFWIVLPNTGKKHLPGERKQTIVIDEKPVKPIPMLTQLLAKSKAESAAKAAATRSSAARAEEIAQMAEIEAELDAEDDNLITIDHRYVKAIEEENSRLYATIAHMKMEQMYQQKMYQQMYQSYTSV
jgi:hypothetical protein